MKQFLCVLIGLLAQATPLWAHPYMIRLGYSTCATCHVSPQGGGLLTAYGQGVEGALSLRVHEYEQRAEQENPRLLYDVRALAGGIGSPGFQWGISGVPASNFEVLLFSSLRASAHHRLTYTIGVASPTSTIEAGGGSPVRVDVPTLVWQYRPADGFELMVGRDALPTGLGSPDPQTFIRLGTDPGSTANPTQVKAFWWNKRWQVTPYVFGPAGDEAAADREWGSGVLAGVVAWNQRAVFGLSGDEAQASTFDRRSIGAYARMGFGKWSVLAEHELAARATSVTTGYVAGHTRVIFVPYRWLETWLSTEELVTYTSTKAHTIRVTPGMQVRVSGNLMAGFTSREIFTGTGRSRTYAVSLTLKSSS
jgi:hypothetical protein